MHKTGAITLVVFAAFLASVTPTGAQENETTPKAEKDSAVRRVIQLKYADPVQINSLLSSWGGSIRPDRGLKVLTVIGSSGQVEAIEEAVKKLDVPPPPTKNVELTAYFLLATRETSQGTVLPSSLNEVVTELKKVLNYQNFTLLNTAVLRAQDGHGADVNGAAAGAPSPAEFALQFPEINVVGAAEAPTVHIHNMSFEIWNVIETQASRLEGAAMRRTNLASIKSNIDIPVGQKVVVGKTSFQTPENALVLVLTAKVL